MIRINSVTRPYGIWTRFDISRKFTPASISELVDWCDELDGREGFYVYRLWQSNYLVVHILDPNHAFLFKVRWV